MISLGKTFEFAAAHKLYNPKWSKEKNEAVFGKCANAKGHGHNYRLHVSVSGPIDPDTGMVLSAADLSDIVNREIIDVLDHKNLDGDVAWFEGVLSTCENLTNIIWDKLDEALVKHSAQLKLDEVKLWETSRIYAVRRRT